MLSNIDKLFPSQEAYEEMACELVSSFPPVDQLAVLLELIVYVIRLGGDTLKSMFYL